MGDVHDHDPAAFDEHLADAEVHVSEGNKDIAVTVTVPVDAETLDGLRAAAA